MPHPIDTRPILGSQVPRQTATRPYGNPFTPPIPQPSENVSNLAACVAALKASMESLIGQRGDAANRAVTFRDLVNYGVLSPSALQSTGGGSSTGGVGSSGNYLPLAGGTVTGSILVTSCDPLGGQFHMAPNAAGTMYGSFWRNDGSNTYLLLTDNNNAFGSWNGLRPMRVDNATGQVFMSHGLYLDSGLNKGVRLTCGSSTFNIFDDTQSHIESSTTLWLNGNTNAPIHLRGYTDVYNGNNDPLRIIAPNGKYARAYYEVQGTRLWSAGAAPNGNWLLADESAGAVRFEMDTGGNSRFYNPVRARNFTADTDYYLTDQGNGQTWSFYSANGWVYLQLLGTGARFSWAYNGDAHCVGSMYAPNYWIGNNGYGDAGTIGNASGPRMVFYGRDVGGRTEIYTQWGPNIICYPDPYTKFGGDIVTGNNTIGTSRAGDGNGRVEMTGGGGGQCGYLAIFHPNGTRMGYLGFDTASPQFYIEVGGDFRMQNGSFSVTNGRINTRGADAGFFCSERTSGNYFGIYASSAVLRWSHNTTGERLYLDSNGHLYPSVHHSMSCGLGAPAWWNVNSANFTNTSDPSLKTDIEPVVSTLAQVRAIEPVTYRWKAGRDTATKQHGFLSTRVREVMGDGFGGVIRDEASGIDGLALNQMFALLWRAVQELTDKVELLEGRT